MKKILAVMMAVVMMMAIAVPAFAASLSETANSGNAEVLTDISDIQGEGTYSVTYPAQMPIKWNATETKFSYSVTSQLKTGKCVSVEIIDTDANGFEMLNADGAALVYTLGGDVTGKTDAPVVTDAGFDYTVNVEQSVWDAAAFDEYKDILTFSSEVVDL